MFRHKVRKGSFPLGKLSKGVPLLFLHFVLPLEL